MRRKIYVLSISVIFSTMGFTLAGQDTTRVPGVLSVGVDLSGPVIYAINSTTRRYEGSIAYHLNSKYYLVAEPGFASSTFSQYNYDQNSSGFFIRLGADMNLMKPGPRNGNHFAGIGFRYGLSLFSQETPWYNYRNYWGTIESSIDKRFVNAHFLEINGGVKAEIFKNLTVGWTIRMSLPVFNSAGADNRPAYIPGIGSVRNGLQPGFGYSLNWILPFKLVRGK